jgi:uncharacterized protein (DUF486 family)
MASEAQPAPVKSHRILIPALLTVATIVAFFACFAVWANRQALNTDHWTKTSSNLLEDKAVQSALSVYLVDQLYKSSNVQERLEKALPGEIKGLAGPVSAGLRGLADEAVPRLLATAQVQELWKQANRNAHKQLLAILNGGGNVVSTNNGEVVLNLHQLLTELAGQVGLSSQLESARSKLGAGGGAAAGEAARATAEEKLGIQIPAQRGQITILKASQLKTAQDVAKGIKGLAWLLPAIGIALFALAIWLAEDRRRRTLRTVGWCFFGVGITLLLARRLAGDSIVESLVKVPANKPAGEAVWSIGTSLLRDISIAMVLYGLALVIAAWIAGRTRIATTLRHAAAPWMREHVAGSYVAAGVLLLLIVLWGPTAATRQWLPVLLFAALFALGVTVLRRQTEAEFPDAAPGESMAVLRSGLRFGGGGHASPAEPDARVAEPPAAVGEPGEGTPAQTP